MQFYGIGNKDIKYIADRNPSKHNCFTPGTKIKIISEANSRRLKPDYYLVLPWHFKNHFLSLQSMRGRTLIFPLPKFEIVKL